MSFAHHSEHDGGSQLPDALREQLANSDDPLAKRFIGQSHRQDKRTYSGGRISPDDDGDGTFVISSDPDRELVRIDFPTPTEWVAMPPQQAIELAQMLIKHARGVATGPLTISLH